MRRLKKILLIDKDINKLLTEIALIESGLTEQVEVVDSCTEASEYLKNNCSIDSGGCPEVIILDSDFPVVEAKEFLKILSTYKSEIDPQIFFATLTADTKEEDIQFLKTHGVQNIIFKPLTEDKLKNLITDYLNSL